MVYSWVFFRQDTLNLSPCEDSSNDTKNINKRIQNLFNKNHIYIYVFIYICINKKINKQD